MGRTLSKVQQVLSWSYGEDVKPFKPPLSDAEFHTYLNHEGQLSRPEELRLRIYHGGVEPSLRKVSHLSQSPDPSHSIKYSIEHSHGWGREIPGKEGLCQVCLSGRKADLSQGGQRSQEMGGN